MFDVNFHHFPNISGQSFSFFADHRIFRAFMNLAADILAELVVIEDYVSVLGSKRVCSSLFSRNIKAKQDQSGFNK